MPSGNFFLPSSDPRPLPTSNWLMSECPLREGPATQLFWNSRSFIRGHDETRLHASKNHPSHRARHADRRRWRVDNLLDSRGFHGYDSSTTACCPGSACEAPESRCEARPRDPTSRPKNESGLRTFRGVFAASRHGIFRNFRGTSGPEPKRRPASRFALVSSQGLYLARDNGSCAGCLHQWRLQERGSLLERAAALQESLRGRHSDTRESASGIGISSGCQSKSAYSILL